MKIGDVFEDKAAELLRDAGIPGDQQPEPEWLVCRALGEGAIHVAPPHVLRHRAALVRLGSRWRIYMREGLPLRQQRFALLHELSHFVLGREASEGDCDALAARLLLPRAVFIAALKRHGRRFTRLASALGATESCIALRLGETTERPLALVTPGAVRLRGSVYSWPSEPVLRELARAPRLPGLRKALLRDDRRRVVLTSS